MRVSRDPAYSLELEASPQLHLPRVADARYEPGWLPEGGTTAVAAVRRSEIVRIEQVEAFDEDADLLVASEAEVLRRPHIEDERVVASTRVQRHLLSGSRVD